MKVSMDQVRIGVVDYIDKELLSKAVGFNKFKIGMAMGVVNSKLPKMLVELKESPIVSMLEVVDDENFIEIDELYNYAKEAIKRSGQFELFGIIFGESDIDKLYTCIKNSNINGGQ